MLKDRMTMLILSCGDFSDLWSGHIKQLNIHWPDHGMRTIIVTDKETALSFPGVEILPVCTAPEWTDRLRTALEIVDTEYIFVTLDDYYLIHDVDSGRIMDMVQMMDSEGIDYLRLFSQPERATSAAIPGYKKIHKVDTQYVYSVNLYSGIWKKAFLMETARHSKNIWQYEVSLARLAREYGAHCAMSTNQDFKILDVVRKGKLLRKAARFFRNNPGVYTGNREINRLGYELKLKFRHTFVRYMPTPIVNVTRNFMIKRGHHYFSQEQ